MFFSESELDDSVRDQDYVPSDDANSVSDVNEIPQAAVVAAPETASSDEDAIEEEATSPKRRKHPAVQRWKISISKEKRLKVESFRNREGKEREAKAIGQPCTSEFCRKSTLRSYQSLSDEQRHGIFDRFWSMKTWEERRSYVHALVNSVDIKQKSSQASRRPGVVPHGCITWNFPMPPQFQSANLFSVLHLGYPKEPYLHG